MAHGSIDSWRSSSRRFLTSSAMVDPHINRPMTITSYTLIDSLISKTLID